MNAVTKNMLACFAVGAATLATSSVTACDKCKQGSESPGTCSIFQASSSAPDQQFPVQGQPQFAGPQGQQFVGPQGQQLVAPQGQQLAGPQGQQLAGPQGQQFVGPQGQPFGRQAIAGNPQVQQQFLPQGQGSVPNQASNAR